MKEKKNFCRRVGVTESKSQRRKRICISECFIVCRACKHFPETVVKPLLGMPMTLISTWSQVSALLSIPAFCHRTPWERAMGGGVQEETKKLLALTWLPDYCRHLGSEPVNNSPSLSAFQINNCKGKLLPEMTMYHGPPKDCKPS